MKHIKLFEQFLNETYESNVNEGLTEGSKINFVTITNDLFQADPNWWVKNKLKVSNAISKALAGCKTKHVIIDIDKTHERIKESLDFTLADIDADDEDIEQTFGALVKFAKHVGARKASDLYLAGGTPDENEDDFVPKGREEKLDLYMYPAMGGALVQIGTFQGEPAFQIDDRQDRFIFVGPKSKNKIT